jgi:hypothetical protein
MSCTINIISPQSQNPHLFSKIAPKIEKAKSAEKGVASKGMALGLVAFFSFFFLLLPLLLISSATHFL